MPLHSHHSLQLPRSFTRGATGVLPQSADGADRPVGFEVVDGEGLGGEDLVLSDGQPSGPPRHYVLYLKDIKR